MSRVKKACTEPSECRSCKAPVLWVIFFSGKRAPFDVTPVPDGTHVLTIKVAETEAQKGAADGAGKVMFAEKFFAQKHEGRNRFTSHFATCPDATEHRR